MSLQNLQVDDSVKTESDFIGGSYTLESGLYPMTIEVAYLGASRGGAQSLTIHAKSDKGENYQGTVYLTSGTAKGGLNTYVDKRGDKQYLPGFLTGNSIALLTVGKNIGDLAVEEKVINLYNYDEKKELPTKVNMFTELLGKEVILGIQKETLNKNVKNDAGDYVPTAETRDQNEISKVFRKKDGLTVAEITAAVTEAQFIKTWDDKFTGVTRDRTVAVASNGAIAGAPSKGATAAPTKSLFNAD